MEPDDSPRSNSGNERTSGLFSFLRTKSAEDVEQQDPPSLRESFSLDNYLPWRDSNAHPPQHVDLRGVTGTGIFFLCPLFFSVSSPDLVFSGNEVAEETAVPDVTGASDTGVMEKIFRGFMPKGSSDLISPLEIHIQMVTGENSCLRISAGPFSEVSAKIINQLKQVSLVGPAKALSLDRMVQRLHLKPGSLDVDVRREDKSKDVLSEAENRVDMHPKASISSPSNLGSQGSMLLSRVPLAVLSCRGLTSLVIEVFENCVYYFFF
jgi:hypothetical protein